MSTATATKSTAGKGQGIGSEFLLLVQNEIEIHAPIATVFESILEEIGPSFKTPDGSSLQLKLEAWPGGRWYRDLGNNTGHFWGHVQVIKPPKLLEIYGPMMMSYPAINHVQYRLTEEGKSTRLAFTHRGFGDFDPQHREGVSKGWAVISTRIKERSER
ncbi:MAG TPA: SRPBCC domain-containing protein [Pirellulales bacterium]